MTQRVRIGELLVDTGLISAEQLEKALELQKKDKRRLGEIIVDAGMVSESKVTQLLSQQLSVPWVSLEYIDFSRQLLNLVTSEIAQEYTLVPIYVRRSKNRKETLYVAIEDPSDEEGLEAASDFSGLPVRAMIAPPSEIRSAIRAYYLGLPPESPPSVPPTVGDEVGAKEAEEVIPEQRKSAPPSVESASAEANSSTTTQASQAGADDEDGEHPPESVDLHVRDSAMPTPSTAKEKTPKMVTLTMLDGTEMKLPASRARKEEVGTPGELTARDLVEALLAEGGGSDMSEVLGEDVNWQRMFGALLSLMLKKHLIHDWEFVRELKH